MPQGQQQILFQFIRALLRESVTLLTGCPPAKTAGLQNKAAHGLIHGEAELAALLSHRIEAAEGWPAEGVFHAHRIEADSQLPLMARARLQIEQIATGGQPADQLFSLDLEIVDQQHLSRARLQRCASGIGNDKLAVRLRFFGGKDGVLGDINPGKLPAGQPLCQRAAVVAFTAPKMDQLLWGNGSEQAGHGLNQRQLVASFQEMMLGAHQGTAVAVFGVFLAGDEIQITFRCRIEVMLVVAIAPLGGFMKMERTAAAGTLKVHSNSLGECRNSEGRSGL